MHASTTGNSRRREFRLRGRSRSLTKFLFPLVALLASCEHPVTEISRPPDHQIESAAVPWHINVVSVPADSGVSLAWVPFPGNFTYSVRWRAAGSSIWNERGLGNRNHAFVPQLKFGVPHEFIVSAMRGPNILSADSLEETPRDRGVCAFASYTPLQTFSCSRQSFEAYLRSEYVTVEDLRCRNQPVIDWGPDSPDCLYTGPDNFHMLLLRTVDSVFHPSANPPSVNDTRSMMRHALWPKGDPFTASDRVVPTLLPDPLVGTVSKYSNAMTFVFDDGERWKSRVTRFMPIAPVPGRYAIYHEGHGGIRLANDMLEFLLERGFEVYAMDMLLIGENAVDRTPGSLEHWEFPDFDDGSTSILAYHLMPIKRVVDFIERTRPPAKDIVLMGRSGGAQMAYNYGTIDPRITAVVSVAGGKPLSQRLNRFDGGLAIGDPEQAAPEIFSTIRREDIMVAGGSKGALIMWNANEPCCSTVLPGDPVLEYLAQGGTRTGRIVRGFSDPVYPLHGLGPLGFAEVDRFLHDVLK